jgi:RNA polymerase sigma factor FliA
MEKSQLESTLWMEYSSNRTLENRNRLFQFYSGWVKKIASAQFYQMHPDGVEWSDFVQNASVALIEAIDRFDLDFAVPFEAFAYPRIKGAIIDGLPKSGTVFLNDVAFGSTLSATHGLYFDNEIRDFDQFIDAILDIAFAKILDISSRRATRLDSDPLDVYINIREEEKVMNAIKRLPADQQFVIISHYNHFLTLSQIGNKMSLSTSRVSQLHRDALKQLRLFYEAT